MNNMHPIIAQALAPVMAVHNVPRKTDDWFTIASMKDALRRHIEAGLLECSAMSRDLVELDPDQVVVDLRDQFDPLIETSAVQDLFSDAFFSAARHLHENKVGEPLTSRKCLPSGAVF